MTDSAVDAIREVVNGLSPAQDRLLDLLLEAERASPEERLHQGETELMPPVLEKLRASLGMDKADFRSAQLDLINHQVTLSITHGSQKAFHRFNMVDTVRIEQGAMHCRFNEHFRRFFSVAAEALHAKKVVA